MKLIIDIDEKAYKLRLTNPVWYDSNIDKAIRNGIPLPKGHGNLYDERDLEKLGNVYFQEEIITNDSNIEFRFPKLIINATPIIEADKGE